MLVGELVLNTLNNTSYLFPTRQRPSAHCVISLLSAGQHGAPAQNTNQRRKKMCGNPIDAVVDAAKDVGHAVSDAASTVVNTVEDVGSGLAQGVADVGSGIIQG